MAAKCLLVTGSRSLAEMADIVKDRVKTILLQYLLGSNIEYVIAGDAKGPDHWAMEVVDEFGSIIERYIQKRCWKLNGYIDPLDGGTLVHWAKLVKNRVILTGASWPLTRDRIMVESVAKKFPGEVRCVGFTNEASRTKGTDFTLDQAKKNGITCDEWTYTPNVVQLFTRVDR